MLGRSCNAVLGHGPHLGIPYRRRFERSWAVTPLLIRNAGSFRACRAAFTLLELVVATVLMATLLTSLLLSLSQQRQMLQLAEHRQAAVLLADELLSNWWDTAEGIPRQSQGILGAQGEWLWRTRVVSSQNLFGKSCVVVRVEVIRRDFNSAAPLVSIDTLQAVN